MCIYNLEKCYSLGNSKSDMHMQGLKNLAVRIDYCIAKQIHDDALPQKVN